MGHVDIPCVDNVNGSGGERVGYAARSIRRGLRVSAANAFLRRAVRRPNVTLLTGTEARRMSFDGTTAKGVEAVRGGATLGCAPGEVMVCAGALTSPLLLERSGVGDSGAQLQAIGGQEEPSEGHPRSAIVGRLLRVELLGNV